MHEQEAEDILALDVALKQNDQDWFEILPDEIRAQIHMPLYYGHVFCHIFHQDYVAEIDCDAMYQSIVRKMNADMDLLEKEAPDR
jgi:D-lactate dehydrogenase